MIAAFDFCKANDIMPFTPSKAFEETWEYLQLLRWHAGKSSHPVDTNPLLVFEAK